MRLLITNGHLHIGGVERSLIDLLCAIDYSRHSVDLLLFEGAGEYLDQVPKEVNIIQLDLRGTYGSFKEVCKKSLKEGRLYQLALKIILTLATRVSPKVLLLLRYFCGASKNYDCAIAYRIGMPASYVSYCTVAPHKVMWWHNGQFDYTADIVHKWNKMLKNIDDIVCVSEATKQMIKPYLGMNVERIVVIPNIVDIDRIRKYSMGISPYNVRGTDKQILCSVGRMSPEKMMINAVYAMEHLVEKGYHNIIWCLVGDGPERKRIEDEIRDRGLQQQFILVGNQMNPYPYIANADLYVHPSYVESQGLTILEAMALHIPCIVTKSLGPCEFVVDHINGLLVEQSAEALANGIEIFLTDSRLSDEVHKNTQCPELFSPASVMSKFEDLLA